MITGLLARPIITPVSRWDRLKGFRPLMEAFVGLKREMLKGKGAEGWGNRRRLDLVRLVLAGPDPASIQDDPEDADELAHAMNEMLADAGGWDDWGRNAQRRTHQNFLVFSQLRAWLRLFAKLL